MPSLFMELNFILAYHHLKISLSIHSCFIQFVYDVVHHGFVDFMIEGAEVVGSYQILCDGDRKLCREKLHRKTLAFQTPCSF